MSNVIEFNGSAGLFSDIDEMLDNGVSLEYLCSVHDVVDILDVTTSGGAHFITAVVNLSVDIGKSPMAAVMVGGDSVSTNGMYFCHSGQVLVADKTVSKDIVISAYGGPENVVIDEY